VVQCTWLATVMTAAKDCRALVFLNFIDYSLEFTSHVGIETGVFESLLASV